MSAIWHAIFGHPYWVPVEVVVRNHPSVPAGVVIDLLNCTCGTSLWRTAKEEVNPA